MQGIRNRKNVGKVWLCAGVAFLGIASLLVSVGYFAGGLLLKAKVIQIDAAAAMIWVFPLLCGIYGIAKMALTRRYL